MYVKFSVRNQSKNWLKKKLGKVGSISVICKFMFALVLLHCGYFLTIFDKLEIYLILVLFSFKKRTFQMYP